MSKKFIIPLLCLLFLGGGVFARWGYRQYLYTVYPDAYNEPVRHWAAVYELPPDLIFAVIHTESGFDPAAVSRAGAAGLMQLMPDTFDWAQYRMSGGQSLEQEQLFDPEINIRYGVFTLTLLLELFPEEDTALAAYNAGQGKVRGWLDDPECSDDGVTLKYIKYPETRNYVKRVREAQAMYRALYP